MVLLLRIATVALFAFVTQPALSQTKAPQAPAVAGGGSHGAATAPGLASGDRLAIAEDWLRDHPDDAHTWRFAASQFFALDRFAEAAHAFERADRLDPAGIDPVLRAAALIRLGRMEDARAVADLTSRVPGERGRLAALRTVAKALVAAGELGRAKTVMDAAIAQAPKDAGLLIDRAGLEAGAGRPLRAIALLERAAQLAPSDPAPRRALVRAWLDAGHADKAAVVAVGGRSGAMALDEQLALAHLSALKALDDHARIVQEGEAYLSQRPRAAPVMRMVAAALAATGAKEAAADRLRKALKMAPPDDDVIELMDLVLPHQERAALLNDLRARFPTMPALWRDDGVPPSDMAWPWLVEAERLAGEGKAGEARTVLEQGLKVMPGVRSGQRALILLRLAELTDEPVQALAYLAEAEKLNVSLGEVLARRTKVLLASGWWDEAAVAAWAWAGIRPDDAAAVAALFRPEVADRLGWPRAFAHLHDHVQRDPDSAARRLLALQYHAATAGSPVLAFAHADAITALLPADDPRAVNAKVLRGAVADRLAGLGRVVEVSESAVIIDAPDGDRLTARFHPITGRLVRFSEGARWIEATWTADGLNLAQVADSEGNLLVAHHQDGRILAIEGKGSNPFKAEIAADGTPVLSSRNAGPAIVDAYNGALALLSSWPRTGLAGARWLRLGVEGRK